MFNELLQRLTLGERVWCVGHTFMKIVGCFDDYWYEYTEYVEDGASYFEITDIVTGVTAGYKLGERPWTVDQIVDAIYGEPWTVDQIVDAIYGMAEFKL